MKALIRTTRTLTLPSAFTTPTAARITRRRMPSASSDSTSRTSFMKSGCTPSQTDGRSAVSTPTIRASPGTPFTRSPRTALSAARAETSITPAVLTRTSVPVRTSDTVSKSYGLAAFESAPTPSNMNARNVNFNFATTPSGTSYVTDFVEPAYTAVAKVAYSATAVSPAPGLAIARNSFNGPMYQDVDVSLAKRGFHIPENRILGDSAMLEFRVDAYNLLNLTELTPTPTTSITSTNFGANTSALGSRTVQLQSRFSF